jgi:two-component system sensor histidine kinase YesM
MQRKLILICLIIIVPVFAASVFLTFTVRSIVQEHAVSEIESETDRMSVRFSNLVAGTETAASDMGDISSYILYGGENPLSEFSEKYPVVQSVYVYTDKSPVPQGLYPITEDVKTKIWYKTTVESENPFWTFTENEKDGYDAVLSVPLKTGDFETIVLLYPDRDILKTLISDAPYPTYLVLPSGIIFASNAVDYPELTYVASSDLYKTAVVESDFLRGDTFIISSPVFSGLGSPFYISLTVPYDRVIESSRDAAIVYIWYTSLCLVLSILISILLTGTFTKRITFVKEQMKKASAGQLDLREELSGHDEINDLYNILRQMVHTIAKKNAEITEERLNVEHLKLSRSEAEFKALASQINPHFLYNTLETIRMKAYANNDKETADLIKTLGKFMRRSLAVAGDLVTVESELGFVHNYLILQSARFGDRVHFNIYSEIPGNALIVPLIIQPLAENSYAHGVESMKTGAYIFIKLLKQGDKCVIEVTDNGKGINEEKLAEVREKIKKADTSSGISIGLTNTNSRIKKFYGDSYGMEIFSEEGKGTTIRVTLPLRFE